MDNEFGVGIFGDADDMKATVLATDYNEPYYRIVDKKVEKPITVEISDSGNAVFERRLKTNPCFISYEQVRQEKMLQGLTTELPRTEQDRIMDAVADSIGITHLSPERKQELTNDIAENLIRIREFILKEVAPVTMSYTAGMQEAVETLKIALDTDINYELEAIHKYIKLAAQQKLVTYICELLGTDDIKIGNQTSQERALSTVEKLTSVLKKFENA